MQCNVPEKSCVVQVAAPQARWILHKAMEPVEARAFHPRRTLPDVPRVEIECCTYTEHQTGVEARQHAVHPQLLAGRADAHPDDVGPERIDPGNDVVFFQRVQFAKWGSVGAQDTCPRCLLSHYGNQSIGDSGLPAIKEMRAEREPRPGKDLEHQRRASHVVHMLEASKPPQPDSRRSVRDVEDGLGICMPKIGALQRFEDPVHSDGTHEPPAAAGEMGLHRRERAFHIYRVDGYAKDVGALADRFRLWNSIARILSKRLKRSGEIGHGCIYRLELVLILVTVISWEGSGVNGQSDVCHRIVYCIEGVAGGL